MHRFKASERSHLAIVTFPDEDALCTEYVCSSAPKPEIAHSSEWPWNVTGDESYVHNNLQTTR